jgi:Xaa-Pro dipeptidase
MDFKARRKKLRSRSADKGIEHILIQNRDSICYLSGFNATVGSRPFGLLLTPAKEVLFTPATAADAVREAVSDMEICVYCEHPAGENANPSFYAAVKGALSDGVRGKALGAEAAYMSIADQAALNDPGFAVNDIGGLLMQMRSIKDPEELDAIRTAAEYVDRINGKALKALQPGISEMELAQVGVFDLYRQLSQDMPDADASVYTIVTSGAGRTALPHTNTSMRKLDAHDFALFCRQVSVNAYRGQADRMGFLGEPTAEQKKYYRIVLNAHAAAMEMIRPGVRAADIDRRIRAVFAEDGLEKYFIHRAGSGIGLGMAEPPYIRFDSDETIEPAMALILQPAVYVPGVGGFRCTDTVIVTETGAEPITRHPGNIEALTLSLYA